MSRVGILILLGLLTIITPFSGLPVSVRTFLVVVFGACVLGIGIAIRSQDVKRAKPLIESTPPQDISPI